MKKERRKHPAASPDHDYSWTGIALAHSKSKSIFHMLFLFTSGFKSDPFPLMLHTREKPSFNPLTELTLTLTFVLGTLQQLSQVDTIWNKC